MIGIQALVERVQKGTLLIRSQVFNWDGEKRLELFDSIAEGLPLGSLLYVCTKEPIGTVTAVGPTLVNTTSQTWEVVMDGHHRVITLFAALAPTYGSQPSGEEFAPDGTPWRVVYDVETKTFTFQTEETRAAPLRYFPLELVLDQYELDVWMRRASQVARNRVRALVGAFADTLLLDRTFVCKDAEQLNKLLRRCAQATR